MTIFNKRGVFLLALLISCSELDEEWIDPELDYQPLTIGKYWEYQVVETNYYGESDAETQEFYLKDIISSHYINEMGEQVFLVQRQKSTDQQNWQQEKVFTYRVSNGTLIRNLDNLSTVCLVFPPLNGETWNGNVYNALPENTFILNVHENYQSGDKIFKGAARITQSQEDDLITLRDHRYEVYVKEIGLVESYYEVLTYCSRNDCLGEQIIDSGRFVHLELIEHG